MNLLPGAISSRGPGSIQPRGSLGEVGGGVGGRRTSAEPVRGKSLFLIKRKLPFFFPLCKNDIFQSMDLFTRLESGKNKSGECIFLLIFTIGNDSAVET